MKKSLLEIKGKIKDKTLIAVSKYSTVEDIRMAYDCGQRDFGENKVQDLEQKSKELQLDDIRWHFIGHLQTNKVKHLLQISHLVSIHSVDSLRLVKELIKRKNLFLGPQLDLFFQLNSSHGEEKSGLNTTQELRELLSYAQKELFDEHFILKGLMTIGKIRTDHFEADARSCFSQMRDIQKELQNDFGDLKLSMGMSQDYEIAVEQGATMLRIGSAIFAG